ncbi:hypothetical protein OAG24_00185 [bacterium]|nr:hypothetical protein [bacterium]
MIEKQEISVDFFKELKVWNIPCYELSKIVDKCHVNIGNYSGNPDVKYLVCRDFYNHSPGHFLFQQDNFESYLDKFKKVRNFLDRVKDKKFIFANEDFKWCVDMARLTFEKSIYFDRIINLTVRYKHRYFLSREKNLKAVALIFCFFVAEKELIRKFENKEINRFEFRCDMNFLFQDFDDKIKHI